MNKYFKIATFFIMSLIISAFVIFKYGQQNLKPVQAKKTESISNPAKLPVSTDAVVKTDEHSAENKIKKPVEQPSTTTTAEESRLLDELLGQTAEEISEQIVGLGTTKPKKSHESEVVKVALQNMRQNYSKCKTFSGRIIRKVEDVSGFFEQEILFITKPGGEYRMEYFGLDGDTQFVVCYDGIFQRSRSSKEANFSKIRVHNSNPYFTHFEALNQIPWTLEDETTITVTDKGGKREVPVRVLITDTNRRWYIDIGTGLLVREEYNSGHTVDYLEYRTFEVEQSGVTEKVEYPTHIRVVSGTRIQDHTMKDLRFNISLDRKDILSNPDTILAEKNESEGQ